MSNVYNIQPKPTPVRPRKAAQQHFVITGRNLAHTSRGARERAMLAAAWVRGRLTLVQPTVTQATKMFGVSQVTINAAVKMMPKGSTSAANAVWGGMFGTDRDQFIHEHADEILASLDRLTTKTA
jgi:hypothetical protein